jgi:hypothetical protein
MACSFGEDILWRVWVLETPFYLVLRFITMSTTRNYSHNYSLRFCAFTQLTILHASIAFLTSSHTLRNLTANCMPTHSLRNWTVIFVTGLYNLGTDRTGNSLFPILLRRSVYCVIARQWSRHGHTKNQLHNSYLASRLARWLLPSNEK